MNYVALKSEVQTDPLVLYTGLLPASPGRVVDALNAKTFTAAKAITAKTALTWAAQGPYSAIVDASNNLTHACRASCLVVRDTLTAGLDVGMDDPKIQAMFNAWVPSIITVAQHDALVAISMQPASRAEILGFGTVAMSDLQAAGVI